MTGRTAAVISLLTAPPISRSSETLRLNPPSKRMIATESETTGKSRSPSSRSGWMR